MIGLERLTDALPPGLDELQVEARAEGHSMLDTLAAQWASGENRFAGDGEMLLAAFLGDGLAGIGGLTRDPHDRTALRVRRFYVRTEYRRRGVGQALAAALLGALMPGQIVVANAAAGSEAFWESLGFRPDRRDGRTHLLITAPAGDA